MTETQQNRLATAAHWLAFGSATSILFSIAVSNILLVLALMMLLFSGARFRFPPVKWPLAAFMVLTVVSLLLSQQPSAGRPQIRKFFIYLTLLVISSTFLELGQVRRLTMALGAFAALSAIRALAQFTHMLQNCGQSYGCLVGERITGFMSHWMTFGGQMMLVVLLLVAYLFWSPAVRRPVWLWYAFAGLIGAALFAGGTRSIWLAAFCAGSFLLWRWKRWTLAIGPVAVGIALLAAPPFLKQRFQSAWKPQGELDSNQHRRVSWRTGWRMIQAHPLLGLGPEHVKLQFQEYVPPDVKRLPEGWYGHLHNIYLHYAAERGIPAMLAILAVLGVALVHFWRAERRIPPGRSDARFVLNGAIAAILAILIGGIFEHNLGDTEVLVLLLTILSCGYVAVEQGHVERA